MKNKSIYLSLIFFLIITVLSSSGAFAHPGRIDSPKNQASGTLQVYYLDVGQGDSTLIRTPENQYILIDAGNNNQGNNVVKYLNHLGVNTLDAVVATHPDADHIGGLDDVIKSINVKSVYAPKVLHTTDTYKDFLLAVKNKGLTIKQAKKDVTIPLMGVTATFLAPVNEYGSDLNKWSAVLRLGYKNNSFLFTGDADIKSETDMLINKSILKADVLKVGSHGSISSSSKKFIDAVKPKYAIISVGKNSYGHPNAGILSRLKDAGAAVMRTDQKGTITAISNGSTITFTTTKGAK
ncbi:MBL fold metallo-hydrolase [Paenibacillus glucanolyticus]|jgi:competence protein ComEC|uniref:ComEC/Rec2 family competence protein n=1 Tax=Paenibacillus TaxID=44249 RepID=UPI0003E2A1C5|nr:MULTISPECIES: ComEC/Rec2 family competence protein [Paenibacillus]ANA79183.1 competence protein [Paenibacillus glucanolyticus]AVV56888.1 MBL fold metallo-hydrolase [Paenibacillus glucanolyticus]ETT32887.1 putative S-layer protein [Paenibacillus sp. FSL R5-808]